MKPKTMILMGLAIACGLGASYMTSRLLAERQTGEEPEKIEILVAVRNLSVGEPLKRPDQLFEKKLVAASDAPSDAIKDPDALKGKIMKQSLRKGDHITPNEMFGDKDSLPIPEGHKAVGLRVNLETGASGFATLPLSRVDIILTVKGADHRSSFVAVLLENVLVLAADAKIDRDGGISSPAQVVTFALKDEELLRVAGAKDMGVLSLALRKPDDNGRTQTRSLTFEDIKSGNKKEIVQEVTKVETKPAAIDQKKVEPKQVVPVEPERPRLTKHYYEFENGSEFGPRQVQRVYYYRTEDGRVLSVNSPEVLEATNEGSKKSGGVY